MTAKCPFRDCTGKPGKIWLWGRITHGNKVHVCREHEQIYRDYGWIRVYRRKKKELP
jgi:hypothetical protein